MFSVFTGVMKVEQETSQKHGFFLEVLSFCLWNSLRLVSNMCSCSWAQAHTHDFRRYEASQGECQLLKHHFAKFGFLSTGSLTPWHQFCLCHNSKKSLSPLPHGNYTKNVKWLMPFNYLSGQKLSLFIYFDHIPNSSPLKKTLFAHNSIKQHFSEHCLSLVLPCWLSFGSNIATIHSEMW